MHLIWVDLEIVCAQLQATNAKIEINVGFGLFPFKFA